MFILLNVLYTFRGEIPYLFSKNKPRAERFNNSFVTGKSKLYCVQSVWPWTSPLTSLNLYLLNYKNMITEHTSLAGLLKILFFRAWNMKDKCLWTYFSKWVIIKIIFISKYLL